MTHFRISSESSSNANKSNISEMEAHARAPDPLTNDGDMANNWQNWKEDFLIFMKVTGYIDKSDEIRANLLKNRIGKIGIEVIQNMYFDDPQDKDNMDILIAKLEQHFNPPKNEVVERFYFFSMTRKQRESIEQHVNNLKEKAKTCNFKDTIDDVIRDKIIYETHDKILRKKLLETNDLNLQKLITIYNDYEINTEKMKQVTKENKIEPKEPQMVQKPSSSNFKKGCWKCGRPHPQGKCPAFGSKCAKCGHVNHFTHCCKGYKPHFGMDNDKINKNLIHLQETKFISKVNNWKK